MPSNLTLRVITVIVLLPVVLALAYLGGWLFVLLVAALAVIGVLEFCALGSHQRTQGNGWGGALMSVLIILAFYLREPLLWQATLVAGTAAMLAFDIARHPGETWQNVVKTAITLAGVAYVGFPAAFLVAIRQMSDGFVWLLAVLLMTWGTDSFAYIGGRLWGRTMLAPLISPKKTLEGAIVGVIGGILLPAAALGLNGKLSPATLVLLIIGPVIAIPGDLIESGLKRAFGVKDSHITGFNIFPGHGGVLDRVDALIVVATFSYIYLLATGLAG